MRERLQGACPYCGRIFNAPNGQVRDIWLDYGCEDCHKTIVANSDHVLELAGVLEVPENPNTVVGEE